MEEPGAKAAKSPLDDNPRCRVNSVEVVGLKATRPALVHHHLRPLLQSQTLQDIMSNLHQACYNLGRLGIFSDVDVHLDTAKSKDEVGAMGVFSALGFGAPPKSAPQLKDAIDVTIRTKEKSRIFLKTGTEVGNNEGNVNAILNVRNVFGGAEMFESSILYGTRNKGCFQMSLSRPVNASPDTTASLSIFQTEQDWQLQSSYNQRIKGLLLKCRHQTLFGIHEGGYELAVRNISRLAPKASLSVRAHAQESIKSSLFYSVTRDTRDHPFLPTTGNFAKCRMELAGIGGNVQFYKSEFESQTIHDLGKQFILSATLNGGLMLPNGADSSILDRFFMGGPSSVRGFRVRGVGPRAVTEGTPLNDDALGGDAYWAAGLSLFTPMPFMSQYTAFKGHFFVNAGSIIPIDGHTGLTDLPSHLRDRFYPLSLQSSSSTTPSYRHFAPISASIGLGIALKTSFCRLEVHLSHPICQGALDKPVTGFQLGIGMNFL